MDRTLGVAQSSMTNLQFTNCLRKILFYKQNLLNAGVNNQILKVVYFLQNLCHESYK
jgi:hypothetical protein